MEGSKSTTKQSGAPVSWFSSPVKPETTDTDVADSDVDAAAPTGSPSGLDPVAKSTVEPSEAPHGGSVRAGVVNGDGAVPNGDAANPQRMGGETVVGEDMRDEEKKIEGGDARREEVKKTDGDAAAATVGAGEGGRSGSGVDACPSEPALLTDSLRAIAGGTLLSPRRVSGTCHEALNTIDRLTAEFSRASEARSDLLEHGKVNATRCLQLQRELSALRSQLTASRPATRDAEAQTDTPDPAPEAAVGDDRMKRWGLSGAAAPRPGGGPGAAAYCRPSSELRRSSLSGCSTILPCSTPSAAARPLRPLRPPSDSASVAESSLTQRRELALAAAGLGVSPGPAPVAAAAVPSRRSRRGSRGRRSDNGGASSGPQLAVVAIAASAVTVLAVLVLGRGSR